jgi:hypothetical protein
MLALRPATVALAGALLLVSSVASAQPTIAADAQYPDRIVGGNDQGTLSLSRGSQFDQYGISYSDCAAGMVLSFDLALAGFTSDETLQIWGSVSPTDCTQPANRTGTAPACWLLATPFTNVTNGASEVFSVNVWDLVGNQLASVAALRTATYAPLDSSACRAQSGSEAVPMYIFFMPIDSSSNVVGGSTLYRYQITTDLVAPAPPAIQPLTVGDTYLTVNWTANTDPDTLGYDVFMYPAPGASADAQVEASAADGPTIECIEAGPESGLGDADCFTTTTGGNAYDAGNICPGDLLGEFVSIYPVAPSTTSTPTDEAGSVEASTDEAGLTEAGSESTSSGYPGIGPIAQMQPYIVASSTTPTVYGAVNGSLQVNNLTNETHYEFVVSSVDAEGNVGPPSPMVCDFPDTTTDFFQSYRADGGLAGGGCALDPQRLTGAGAGVAGLGLLLAAAVRRRRRS